MSDLLQPGGASDPPPERGDPKPVEEALRALAAALRSYRLYESNNPMLERFVQSARQKVGVLWEVLEQLRLQIEEDRILWEGQLVFTAGEAGGELPFLFYKDGIREVTILPGFEDREVVSLLRVLARAPAVREEEDDLITLLWQEDLTKLRYTAVEANEEGAELPSGSGSVPGPVDAEAVRSQAAAPAGVTTEDFQETLYFLDEAELRKLRDEVARETHRDLWRDVVNALLDRLEDGGPERQLRVVAILAELLPSALGSGQFERSAALLQEIVEVAGRGGVLSPAALRETRSLFDALGSDDTVIQLADILEEMPDRLSDPAVLRLLSYFPPASIGALMRAADRVEQPSVKRAFEACVQRLAEANRDHVVGLLGSPDAAMVAGALRWVGRLEVGTAVSEVIRFLQHPATEVRLAAVEALVSLRAAASASAVVPLLEDPAREVRLAAARALGAFPLPAARSALEAALSSRRIREADRTEKVAFFEAFGRIAGPEGVPVLDRMLNNRSWLGRGEASEIRASAALALGKIRHPTARDALGKAANDSDAVVRTAVARALRGEAA